MKAQCRQEYRERIPIEGKFCQGKNGYRLNKIRAKRADTSVAWTNSIFLVMSLLLLVRVFSPEESFCQNSIFGDKKGHARRNPVCTCQPSHLKQEFLLGSVNLIAEFLINPK
ncbi:hypothetical protein [Nitrosomonas sp.]|uniref:hypothetical protein n=1 Tax=Nitrosomonas sp. TaxID=42353 RepID=UPI0025ECBB53|nr:hypothetical protein [Nitrosomonas sp.]